MTKQIITVVNQKGGVGKTTTCINVASYMAMQGFRVLIIDLDSQGNASGGLGFAKEQKNTIYEVLIGKCSAASAIQTTTVKGLDIICSNPRLSGFESESTSLDNREFVLKKHISDLKYDYIFIDCPPSLGVLTINALAAANSILIAVQTEYYAMEGLSQLLNTTQAVQANINKDITILGVLLTMFDRRTSLSMQVKNEVEKYFGELVFKTTIPRNVRLAEAPSFGRTIHQHDQWSKGARAYKALTKEIIKRTT